MTIPAGMIQPAAPAPKQSLWDRIQSMVMPQTGLAEMLSPEQMAEAHRHGLLSGGLAMMAASRGIGGGNAPSLGQALAGGVDAAQAGSQGYANQLVQGMMQASQAHEYNRVLNARETMRAMFAPKAGETAEQTRDRIAQMYAYALMQDSETAKEMAPAMRGVMTLQKDPTAATNAQAAAQAAAALKKQKGDYNTLKAVYPTHPLVTKNTPFDPDTDYTAALAQAREMEKVGAQNGKDHWTAAGVDPKTGLPVMINTATGETRVGGGVKPGAKGAVANLPAPMALRVGQFGEMLKKGADLLPATDALNVALGSSAARDLAQGAHMSALPGMSALGHMMMNSVPEYSKYQAALTPFVMAAAHATGGARITQEQINQIRAGIEIQPKDPPAVRQQKVKNLVDLMNSVGGALPSSAVATQEDQMDPEQFKLVQGYGYKAAARAEAAAAAGAPAPSGGSFRSKTGKVYHF